MPIPSNIPCGQQDAQFDGLIDLALSYAPEIGCPNCGATFFALQGNGEYECPECGIVMVVDLALTRSSDLDDTQPRGIVR